MDPFKPADDAGHDEGANCTSSSAATAAHGGGTTPLDDRTAMAVKAQMELDAAIALSLQADEEDGFFLDAASNKPALQRSDDISTLLGLCGTSRAADSEQKPRAENNALLGEDILDRMDDWEGAFFAGPNRLDGGASSGMVSNAGLVVSDQTISDSKDKSLQAVSEDDVDDDDDDDDDDDESDKKPAARTDTGESITTKDTDAALAQALSKEEVDAAMDFDVALALSLQEEEHAKLAFGADNTSDHPNNNSDCNVARAPTAEAGTVAPEINTNLVTKGCAQSGEACWNRDEQLALSQLKEEHQRAMNYTFSGRAWTFVETVVEEHKKLSKSVGAGSEAIKTVAVNDMLAMVERFAEAHAVFQFDGKDAHVDIGYHFTRSANLDQIQTTGLLTKIERQAKGVENNYNGSAWGDGVYTGNNPYAFNYYGDIGLLVARLRGSSIPASRGGRGLKGDTAIANEGFSNEMVILGQSYQCVPLLRFQRGNADRTIWTFHCKLQEIVDMFFNNGIKTGLNPSQPPANWSTAETVRHYISRAQRAHPTVASPSSAQVWQQRASEYQRWKQRTSVQTYELPKPMNSSPCKTETFRRFEEKSCNKGEMMRILFYSKDKLACDNACTFIIVYGFREGQGLIHRIEYLPDIPPSRDIIERLKYAFQCGVVDKTTLPKIPRTSPYEACPGHASKYIRALDRLKIPQADECRNRSSKKRPAESIVDDVSPDT